MVNQQKQGTPRATTTSGLSESVVSCEDAPAHKATLEQSIRQKLNEFAGELQRMKRQREA